MKTGKCLKDHWVLPLDFTAEHNETKKLNYFPNRNTGRKILCKIEIGDVNLPLQPRDQRLRIIEMYQQCSGHSEDVDECWITRL